MNKHTEMMDRINNHGLALLALFPNAKERDPVSLCKKLRRLEGKGHSLALENCNFGMDDTEYDRRSRVILGNVRALLGLSLAQAEEVGLFLNGDPRGYALKLNDEFIRGYNQTAAMPIHTDWGYYGILAPDLR
jgi:hypothetical protein